MKSSSGKACRKASAKGLQHVTHPNKSSLDSKKVSAVCKDRQRLQVSQEKPSASQQIDSDQTGIIKDEGETPYLSDSKRISTEEHHPVNSTNHRTKNKQSGHCVKPSEEERQPGDIIHPPGDRPKKTSDQSSGLNKNNCDQDLRSKLRGSPSPDLFGSESSERAGKLKETNPVDFLHGCAPKKVVQENPIPSQTEGKSTVEAARGRPRENQALRSSTTVGDPKTNIVEILRGHKNQITYDSKGVEKKSVRPNLESEKQNSASGKESRS